LDDFTAPWGIIDAIWHIDEHGDKAPLLKLLRDGGKRDGDYYLADLLERYDLKHPPRGRRRTPAYDLTRRERVIALACNRIRDRLKGMSVAAAIEEQVEACKDYGVTISADALEAAYHGKRGGSRPGKRGARYKKKPGRKAPA
jgi:hypothetical protein